MFIDDNGVTNYQNVAEDPGGTNVLLMRSRFIYFSSSYVIRQLYITHSDTGPPQSTDAV